MPKSHPKCHFCAERRWPISKTWSRQHGEPVCTRCGEASRRQYVLGRPAPEGQGRLPSAIRHNPASLGGDSFRVVAHGKNGEVAFRGRELHRTYGAAWKEAQVVAKRRDLTDVHIVKNGQHIVGEIKARKNPTKTFFCFPCGRRFIATGSASQANCPDCRRVCQATRVKGRTNPNDIDVVWCVIRRGAKGADVKDVYYVPASQYHMDGGRLERGMDPSDFPYYVEEVWPARGPKSYDVFDSGSMSMGPIKSFKRLSEAKAYVEKVLRFNVNPRRRARRGR